VSESTAEKINFSGQPPSNDVFIPRTRGDLSPIHILPEGDSPDPDSDAKKNRKKKNGNFKSFAAKQEDDLNVSLVNEQLEMYKTTLQCCAMACLTWMTIGMVMVWRFEYVGLSSHKERRKWLENKFDEMETSLPFSSTISFEYALNVKGHEAKKVCRRAFDFAYGIPTQTHKECSRRSSKARKRGYIKGSPKKWRRIREI
jgi:hypothetical protein